MTAEPLNVALLFEGLAIEGELALEAATAANVAMTYDHTVACLLRAADPLVIALALARVDDPTPVRRGRAPHERVEGGYGKTFGVVCVGDKARFLLERLLGSERAAEAIATGAPWLAGPGQALVWDARTRTFKPRERRP